MMSIVHLYSYLSLALPNACNFGFIQLLVPVFTIHIYWFCKHQAIDLALVKTIFFQGYTIGLDLMSSKWQSKIIMPH